MSKIKKGDIENFINAEKEKVWDAFLSIDVKQKQGDEKAPISFMRDVKETNEYQAISKFLEENNDPEVYFTDDILDFSKSRISYNILRCAIGKNVLIHIRVDSNLVKKVKKDLYEKAEALSDDILCILYWRDENKDFVLDLKMRSTRLSDCYIRVCDDGSCVAMYLSLHRYIIEYFTLEKAFMDDISSKAKDKIDEIYNNPVYTGEDDRCWFLGHLKYGLYWQYPNADAVLKKHQCFDDTEYSDDVNKIKLAKQLLSNPKIKEAMAKFKQEEKHEKKY